MIRNPVAILILLTGLNFLNYLDRFVVAAVLPKMETALGLSHFQGGFLATIFLVGYFLTSPIFGRLGDTGSRKMLIAMGVAVWSLATVASGFATSATSLVVARALVGVGEASYATLAPTVLDDIAPPEKRGRWLSIFYLATPIGSACGFLVGGAVEKAYGWREAFYVAGGPGIVLALLCLAIAEPPRVVTAAKEKFLDAMKNLFAVPNYRHGVLGYCAYTFAIGGFSFWAPSFLVARYKMELGHANFVFGGVTVITGAIGTVLGGFLGDRAVKTRLGPEPHSEDAVERATVLGNLRVCAWASIVAAPLAAIAFLMPTATTFFAVVFLCEIAVFLTSSPVNVVILRSVPHHLRASAMAISIFAIHLLGDLWSPPLMGKLADHMPMQLAMQAMPVAIVVSALLWWKRPSTAPAG
ncbi:MAG: MFS transporter [Polyangiaceae bacterium]